MKTLVTFAVFAVISGSALAYDKQYANYQYPYSNLVIKAEEVAVLSVKQGKNVKCRVKVVYSDTWISGYKLVSSKAFDKAPLSACLSRDDAKHYLKKMFS